MKTTLKKFLSLACVTIITLSMSVTAFASETQQLPQIESAQEVTTNSQNIFSMDTIVCPEDNENGITPFMTFIGDGGRCTLDYLSSGRYVAWTVKPDTILPYMFSGEISIYTVSTGAYRGTGFCSATGFGTGSGIVDVLGMRLNPGTVYRAEFSGTATDATGNIYTVSPFAKISFTY